MKLPISAVLVTYNEDRFLEQALSKLKFCDEIIVIDLGSSDESIEIAKKYATKIINLPRVPVVEIIHNKLPEYVKNKWVLIQDPDEVIDDKLASEIKDLFINKLQDSKDIGAVIVPWLFYFKNRKLKGTVWGGENYRVLLVHIDRFIFTADVHRGRRVKKGYKTYKIEHKGDNIVHHFWAQSWQQLFSKHKRYIKKEGEARFNLGQKTNLKNLFVAPFKAFKQSFWIKKGYKDGLLGLLLSLFWAWYSLCAEINLYRYQRKYETEHNNSK